MKTIIKLSLEDQVLKATESPVIASGGVNENRIEFTFSEHWDNYTKVAVFSRTDDTADEEPIAIELLNDSCDVPFEVIEEEGTVLIGVFGVLGDVTRTSTNIEYNIVKGSLLNGRAPAAPTKNIYQQLLEKYTQLQTNAYNDFAGSILQSSVGEAILVTDSAERPLQGLRLFGKTTATEISEEVVVGTGKNILPAPYADGDTTISGITFTNTEGKLYLSGTATDAITYNLGTIELEAGTYTLSRVESLAYDMFGIMWNISAEGITVPEDYSNELSFSFTLSEKTYVSISFDTWGGSDDAGVGVDGLGVDGYIQIQLEEGDTATEWEAYTEITETRTRTEYSNVGDSGSINVTITDGKEDSQTLGVSTPDGLASVGDVCDEIDFAKGIFIQRIGGDTYTVLETPIETPLSESQIEAFKAIYTHYPNTSITNDSGAEMEVVYIVDTKTYIDNQKDAAVEYLNADFIIGRIVGNLGIITYQKTASNICSNNVLRYDRDITLTVADGYIASAFAVDDANLPLDDIAGTSNLSEFVEATNMLTGGITGTGFVIPANTNFFIVIRPTDITAYPNADLELYKKQVTISTAMQEEINGLKRRVSALENPTTDYALGLNILCLGDSIFGNDGEIVQYLSELNGSNVVLGAIGGTRVCIRTNDDNWKHLDGQNLVQALMSGDWTAQDSAVEALKGTYTWLPDRIATLKALDMSTVDWIVMDWGTNDYVGGHSVEEILDAYNTVIDSLQSNYPELRILITTPIWRYFDDSENGDNKVFADATLKEIAEAIDAFAKKKRVSVLNAYENMPLNYNTASTYFDSTSGVHLNAKGNMVYAQLLDSKLRCPINSGGSGGADGEVVDLSIYYTKDETEQRIRASGSGTSAPGDNAAAEGIGTVASGEGAHAEGGKTVATYPDGEGVTRIPEAAGRFSHVEGINTRAEGAYSHTEGNAATALGMGAHGEGHYTVASGDYCHAEGERNISKGNHSHSEGHSTKAIGEDAHSEGRNTEAIGDYSHAGGLGTKATAVAQTAIGKYNAESADALLMVGNGTSDTDRKNAFEVVSNGDGVALKVGHTVVTESQLQKLLALLS